MQEQEVNPTNETNEEDSEKKEQIKTPLSHAKLSSLAKARSAKLLKQQQQNYKEEMTMTTLNNIYEKLNMIDSRLFTLGKRTTLDEQTPPPPKKQKQKEEDKKVPEPPVEPRSYLSYLPTVGLFIFSSVLTKYATNKLREKWTDGYNTTGDRDAIPWNWFQRDFN